MRRILALLLLAALPVVPARAQAAYERVDAMVAMSDGVRLDASLYVPSEGGPFPLIVRQHGGGSNKDSAYDVAYGLKAVETGRFALLTYSHRGHGASEGIFDFFGPRTTADFSEMLDWVATARPDVDADNTGASGHSQGEESRCCRRSPTSASRRWPWATPSPTSITP